MMIKVRVDWYHKCLGCGTEVVVDFIQEPDEFVVCPWCGCASTFEQVVGDKELKNYLTETVKEMEQRVNSKMAVKG